MSETENTDALSSDFRFVLDSFGTRATCIKQSVTVAGRRFDWEILLAEPSTKARLGAVAPADKPRPSPSEPEAAASEEAA